MSERRELSEGVEGHPHGLADRARRGEGSGSVEEIARGHRRGPVSAPTASRERAASASMVAFGWWCESLMAALSSWALLSRFSTHSIGSSGRCAAIGQNVTAQAASGKARSALSRQASLARIVRSAWSWTRPMPRTRRGSSAHSCLRRPNSHSTAPRLRYRSLNRLLSRGMSGCSLSARSHIEPGLHSPVGQRHLVARRW
jgi:hypothetical protein